MRFVKSLLAATILALSSPLASAFSLLGVPEAWQVQGIGYNVLNSDIGAPKNLGEEYRWTSPIITYGYDDTFLTYFGSEGVAAIERAIGIINSLPPVSSISSNLSEFPLIDEFGIRTKFMDARRINGDARALQLIDLKSQAMGLLMEEMGLANPERWTWALRARAVIGNPPETNYLVIQRNFDPVSYEPTAYINGQRYTYNVEEFNAPVQFADAVERPVDPNIPSFTTVAGISGGLNTTGQSTGVDFGIYYTYLTRDDIGGLRYLYRTNNINIEPFPPNTQIFAPDRTNFLSLTNLDLTLLSLLSRVSTPAQISNLYPGISIATVTPTSTGTVVVPVVTTNTITIGLFTNTAQLQLVTNIDLALFSSITRTAEPPVIQALFGVDIVQTNLVGLTTEVQIASIGLTNLIGPVFTNRTNLTILTNRDLHFLSRTSLTSPPALMAQTFPEIIIAGWEQSLRTIVEPLNVYLTNAPRQPWEVAPIFTNFTLATNYVTNLQTLYFYRYANVITNYVSPITRIYQFTTGLEKEPWSSAFNPIYKSNTVSYITNEISGGYTVIPPGQPNTVGYEFVGPTTVNQFWQTNFIFSTNIIDTVNGTIRPIRALELTLFTNVQSAAYPIELSGIGQQTLVTNYVTNIVRLFDYRFRNVITNFASSQGLVTVQDLTIRSNIFLPNVPPVTNISTSTFLSNFVNGSIVVFPTNLFGYHFTGLAITNRVTVTNVLINAFNPNTGEAFVRQVLYDFPAIIYGVYPIEFLPAGFVTNILTTNLVSSNVTLFAMQFGNVITNPPPFRFPSGSPVNPTTAVTNYVYRITTDGTQFFTNLIAGPFAQTIQIPSGAFLIDTNRTGYEFSGVAVTNIISVTNTIPSITDPLIFTNLVYRFTNVVYGVYPFVLQAPPAAARRPGVDKINFVRVGGTNLAGQDFSYTNIYQARYITNGGVVVATFVQTNARPDIMFFAGDLGVTTPTPVPVGIARTFSYQNNAALNPNDLGQTGGPGTIQAPVNITFSKIGPWVLNQFPGFTAEPDLDNSVLSSGFRGWVWGSFDGSTNPPIVFPKEITLEELELRVLQETQP